MSRCGSGTTTAALTWGVAWRSRRGSRLLVTFGILRVITGGSRVVEEKSVGPGAACPCGKYGDFERCPRNVEKVEWSGITSALGLRVS